ncbi:hypothetical protein M9458_024314, partial [Cirrhinus mrigala]
CSQMCSMGFKSGDRAGHSILEMPSSSKNSVTSLARRGPPLSSVSTKSGHVAPSYGRTTGLRISSLYLWPVRLPFSMMTSSVFAPMEMPPHTMTDDPPIRSCCTTFCGKFLSPGRRQTLLRLSRKFTQNRDSSVRSTVPHRFYVHLRRSQTCQFVRSGKRHPHSWSSGSQANFMKSSSHSLNGHSHPCCILKVILQADCRHETISAGMQGQISVLIWCCDPLSASTILPAHTTKPSEPVPGSGNDTLRRPHCVCNFTLSHASLQHLNGPVK